MSAFILTHAIPAQPGAPVSYYSTDLCVLAGPERIQAAQVVAETGLVISVMEYSRDSGNASIPFEKGLAAILSTEEYFNKPYHSEKLGIISPYSTLVPQGLFNRENIRDHLSLNFHIPGNQVFFGDEIYGTDILNAYCLPDMLVSSLKEHNPGVRMAHATTALVAGLVQDQKGARSEEAVYCQIRGTTLDIVLFRSANLVFFNSFPFNNKEECVYYLLYSLEQAGFNATPEGIRVFGDVEQHPGIDRFLSDFTGKVTIGIAAPSGVSAKPHFGKGLHRYFNLLSLQLCG